MCFIIFNFGLVLNVLGKPVLPSPQKEKAATVYLSPKRSSAWIQKRPGFGEGTSWGGSSRFLKSLSYKLLQGKIPDNWEDELNKVGTYSYWGNDQKEVLLILFTKWAEMNFEDALQRAGKLGTYSHTVKSELLSQLAKRNPREALLYYENNKESLLNHPFFLNDIAKNWALISPSDALDWCLSDALKDNIRRDKVISSVMEGLSQNAENQTIKNHFDTIQTRIGYIPYQIMENWAETNAGEALEWLYSDEKRKESYRNPIIRGIAKNDLNKASRMLSDISEKERYSLISDIASDMEKIRGEKTTLDWVKNMVPADRLEEHHLSSLSSWTTHYTHDARKWIEELPDSRGKDYAILVYSKSINSPDLYDGTLNLIQTMSDSKQREEALNTILKNWQDYNPVAFDKWKKHSPKAQDLESAIEQNSNTK